MPHRLIQIQDRQLEWVRGSHLLKWFYILVGFWLFLDRILIGLLIFCKFEGLFGGLLVLVGS